VPERISTSPAPPSVELTAEQALVSVTQTINPSLAKGMKVYIQGSGNDARVVPQGG
jgi:hypothetical protein